MADCSGQLDVATLLYLECNNKSRFGNPWHEQKYRAVESLLSLSLLPQVFLLVEILIPCKLYFLMLLAPHTVHHALYKKMHNNKIPACLASTSGGCHNVTVPTPKKQIKVKKPLPHLQPRPSATHSKTLKPKNTKTPNTLNQTESYPPP